MLSQLSTRMPLGLLSNGNGYPERSGLTGMFTVVVFSDDHGISKPGRRLFDIAANQIGFLPGRLAMVGDSLTHDIAGAQHAGWHGIWLNRDRRAHPDHVRPDAELHPARLAHGPRSDALTTVAADDDRPAPHGAQVGPPTSVTPGATQGRHRPFTAVSAGIG